jgi:hypothetical protein
LAIHRGKTIKEKGVFSGITGKKFTDKKSKVFYSEVMPL